MIHDIFASVQVDINKDIYNSDDPLRISVTENLAYGYDLYAALVMPDGQFVTFQGSSLLSQEFNKPDEWRDSNRIEGGEFSALSSVLDDMIDDVPES